MRIAFLNRTTEGSTGSIAFSLFNYASTQNDMAYFYCFDTKKDNKNIRVIRQFILGKLANKFFVKMFGNDGFANIANTIKLKKIIKKDKIEAISIHNFIGYFLNFPMLIKFLRKNNIKIFITMHDCWYFTGKCPHFELAGCKKWKQKCGHCPLKKSYPQSFLFDTTKRCLKIKKNLYSKNDITFISPSEWLMNYAKDSIISSNKIVKINNGIDLAFFEKTKEKHKNDKINLLAIAYPWYENKGVSDLIYLSNKLDELNAILHIAGAQTIGGITNHNVIFHGFLNKEEVRKVMNEADFFVNPTKQDNFPTTDIEALACGLPIISYDTGGSSEIIGDCGIIVEKGNKKELYNAIKKSKNLKFSSHKIKARSKLFSEDAMCEKYFKLFHSM